MKHSILAGLLALTVAGCASAGNQVLKTQDAGTVDQQVIDGKTTKGEIRTLYGDPSQTSFTDGGNEIWTYTYAYATPMAANFVPVVGIFAGGSNIDKKQLVILFDRGDTVVRHTMSVTKQQIQRGQ